MKLRKIITMLAGALLFFYSCAQPLSEMNSSESGDKTPTAISSGESGNLSISVPLISSALQQTLEQAEAPSRAYLFAKEVVITLLDSSGTEISQSAASFPGGSLDNPGAALTAEMEVPWGQDYTVRVQILDGSADEIVLVEGESASFDMAFDQVGISVTLLPSDPVALASAGSYAGSLTASVYGTDSFTSMGEETWYALSPASAEMSVLTVDTTGEAMLFLADAQGAFQSSAREHDASQPTVLTASMDGTETAYAGLIILDDTAQSESYTLTYQSISQGILSLNLTGMADEAASPMTVEIIPAGETEAVASLSTTLTGSDTTLYVFEADGQNLWEGAGEYECRFVIDRDSSGEADRDDLVLTRAVTMSAGVNSLDADLSDFALFSPDIAGRWYSLNDETDIDPAYVVTEIVADIDENGTFMVYARRHQSDWDTANLDPDAFLPIIAGTWVLDGYELSATVETANILNFSVLDGSLDDAYYAVALSYLGLTGEDMLTYDETDAAVTSILSLAALMGYDIVVDTALLDGLFQTFTQDIDDIDTATTDGTAVDGYQSTIEYTDGEGALQSRTYSLIDTYLATELGNESFRTPLDLP